MKVNITTSYGKRLKYKIFAYDGKRRSLLCEGKFLHRTEAEIKTTSCPLIVRVQRQNLLIAFLKAVYAVIVNLSLIPNRHEFSGKMPQYLALYPFEEIRIVDKSRAEVEIRYNAAPLTRLEYTSPDQGKTLLVDYLTSTTHKYVCEYSGRKTVNKVLYTFAVIFWIALITAVCLLIRFLVLHL